MEITGRVRREYPLGGRQILEYTATILLRLEAAKPLVMPPPKPRLDRDPRSRG